SGPTRTRASRRRCPCPSTCGSPSGSVGLCSSNECADALALHGGGDGARAVNVQNDQRERVLLAERHGVLVHHLELLQHHVTIADLLVERGRRILLGVG